MTPTILTFLADLPALATETTAWWSAGTAGIIGGIGGSLVGIFGGLIGSLAGTGRARRFVLTAMPIIIGLGVAAALVGLIALIQRQPYAVYYPLLLLGGLTAVIMGALYPTVRNRYRQDELRKMRSQDL